MTKKLLLASLILVILGLTLAVAAFTYNTYPTKGPAAVKLPGDYQIDIPENYYVIKYRLINLTDRDTAILTIHHVDERGEIGLATRPLEGDKNMIDESVGIARNLFKEGAKEAGAYINSQETVLNNGASYFSLLTTGDFTHSPEVLSDLGSIYTESRSYILRGDILTPDKRLIQWVAFLDTQELADEISGILKGIQLVE